MVYDLHAHTTASDGTLSPTELVNRAAEMGVETLAITDHDTVNGLPEAALAAQSLAIRLIPGVEISATWSGHTIHVVGLGVNTGNSQLHEGLAQIHQLRIQRAEAIALKLEKQGVDGAWEAACEMAGTRAVTRTHFARLLVSRGVVTDFQKAFKKWLGYKGKAFVSMQWASLENVVEWIKHAGGQAVLAHPGRYQMSGIKKNALVEEFKKFGGDAIEVSCSSHDPSHRKRAAELARKHSLLASVGSDFHTPGLPHIELGYNLALPQDLTPVWQGWPGLE